MPAPTSQQPSPLGRPDVAREAALGRALSALRPEHHDLARILTRPGVPWVRWAPHWLRGMRTELKHAWDGPGQRFKRLLLNLLGVAPELVGAEFGAGLFALCRLPWVRPLAAWPFWDADPEPRSQFAHLVAHLTMRWTMPAWVADALLDTAPAHLPFLRALLSGQSLRRLVGSPLLPIPLCRRACHRLLATPSPALGFVGNLRAAQLDACGAKPTLATVLIVHRWCARLHDQPQEERLATVLAWMCRHQDLIPRPDVVPVFEMLTEVPDYPVDRRGPARVLGDARRFAQQPVAEPAVTARRASTRYRSSGLPGGSWAEAVDGRIQVWSIDEVLSRSTLYWEGVKMSHCVSLYHPDLCEGSTSIWSLRLNGRRALTIEVLNRQERVVQVRGRTNRAPRPHEWLAVRRWATDAGLELSDVDVR